jgi:hypothetical protein
MGGQTLPQFAEAEEKFYSDVWNTEDGINWECHTPYANWEAREYHDVAVWDNKLWILEGSSVGQIRGIRNRNDVWFSENGDKWTELPNTPWKPRHASSILSIIIVYLLLLEIIWKVMFGNLINLNSCC